MINEQQYPISNRWLYLEAINSIIKLPILILILWLFYKFSFSNLSAIDLNGTPKSENSLVFILVFIVASSVLQIIYAWLVRANFHYSLAEEFLVVKAGILAKTEQHIPYAKMQNIIVSQSFLDQILKLSNLEIENASPGTVTTSKQNRRYPYAGKEIYIPGLNTKNAEALKQSLTTKINEYKNSRSTEGL